MVALDLRISISIADHTTPVFPRGISRPERKSHRQANNIGNAEMVWGSGEILWLVRRTYFDFKRLQSQSCVSGTLPGFDVRHCAAEPSRRASKKSSVRLLQQILALMTWFCLWMRVDWKALWDVALKHAESPYCDLTEIHRYM
jgi:hypothetical protein